MTEPTNSVEVTLLGRTYRVACEESEREALMQAVAYLDGKMNEIRKAGKVMGAERIAVMAALNIANDLLRARREAAPAVSNGFDAVSAQRRIEAMQQAIEQVLASA